MAISLLGDISQGWQNVTTFSSQAVNQVTETSLKAKESLTNSANTAVKAIAKSTNQAVETLTQTTEKAKGVLSDTANQAVNTIMANTEQAKASLEASIKKAESVSGEASKALETAISSLIGDWINAHPKLFWLVSHPFISLAIFFLVILVVTGLLKALGQFFEKGWLVVLQVPIILSRLVFGAAYQSISGLFGRNNLVSEQESLTKAVDLKRLNFQSCDLDKKERLAQILSRLDAINQEQNKLIQEAVAMLRSDEVRVN